MFNRHYIIGSLFTEKEHSMKFFHLVDNIVRQASLTYAQSQHYLANRPKSSLDNDATRALRASTEALADTVRDFEEGVAHLEWAEIQVQNNEIERITSESGTPRNDDDVYPCKTCLGIGTHSKHPDDPENCRDCNGTGSVIKGNHRKSKVS
jgi:DnaJ-class molecular chaperone